MVELRVSLIEIREFITGIGEQILLEPGGQSALFQSNVILWNFVINILKSLLVKKATEV